MHANIRSILAAALLAPALPSGPALAWNETLDTPQGVARVVTEGEGLDEVHHLLVGERDLFRTREWMRIWPEAVANDWLLVGLTQGGTACPMEWMWIDLKTGALSDVFGTCGMAEEVREEPDGSVSVFVRSYDPDFPIVQYTYGGAVIREFPQPQQPAALPPGGPADDWVGRFPGEMFRASDWRGPLVELLGEESYQTAQAAFSTSRAFEVEGDWVVASGCVVHACASLEGRIAMHRGDGRLLVVIAWSGEVPWIFGDPKGPLPAKLAELALQF